MTATLVAVIAAIAAPLGAYLVAARRFSGKIESSDAKELWAESRAIREWSQNRISMLEQRVSSLESSGADLMRENTKLLRKVQEQAETIEELEQQVRHLCSELKGARHRISELESNGV